MSNWPRRASFLVAIALTVGSAVSATALAQEDPTEDPTIALPPVPTEVGDRLPDLQQRHPWVPNDAPWPWNMSMVQGSWQNPNASITPVYCGPTVASQNPYWYQENLLYTQYSGGARCNVQMQSITGTAHLLQWNGPGASTPELTSAPIGSQHAVPAGHGSGWQAYAYGYYTRSSDDQNLQIRLDVRLELPPYGTSNGPARWNTVPNNCTRDANIRVIHCQLFSVPFRYAPYPCPSGKIGAQPAGCENPFDPDVGTPTTPESGFEDFTGDTTGVEDSPGAGVAAIDPGTDALLYAGADREAAERITARDLSLPETAAQLAAASYYVCGISFRRKIKLNNRYDWGMRLTCPNRRPFSLLSWLVRYKRDSEVFEYGYIRSEKEGPPFSVFNGNITSLPSRPRVVVYGYARVQFPSRATFVGMVADEKSVNNDGDKYKCKSEGNGWVRCDARSISFPKPN